MLGDNERDQNEAMIRQTIPVGVNKVLIRPKRKPLQLIPRITLVVATEGK